MTERCENFVNGKRVVSSSTDILDITNPATGELISTLPLTVPGEVDQCVESAQQAFGQWSRTPVSDRAQVLFRYKQKLESSFDELSELVVRDNGKTLAESRGEVRRGIEVVDYACGITAHIMGSFTENLAQGIDCHVVRQPLGVVAGFTPFNFPIMVPLWTIPIAIACGNSYILKPSERAPLAALRLAELFHECGAPDGTFNVIHGTRSVADCLMKHPGVMAISLVGSSPVAKQVYINATAESKRVQALGGAKNALIVMPDADLDFAVDSIGASGFGCAGQRCLAGSNVIAVGKVAGRLKEQLHAHASALTIGSGLDPMTTMGPVISAQSRDRVVSYIEAGEHQGAHLLRDGRQDKVTDLPDGFFIGPTLFEVPDPSLSLACDEIFGPLLSILSVPDLDHAIELVNASSFGNSASIYTTSGSSARQFQREVQAGMLGVNLGVPAPTASFPFGGWKGSFFGDLRAQGKEGIEFYTRPKVITARWG